MVYGSYVSFISNGREISVSAAKDSVELEPHDQVFQSDECTCTHKEHIMECEIENVDVDVRDARKKISHYIVEMAFCKECGAYYIPQKSYELLSDRGVITHPVKGAVTLYKYFTSGDSFDEEKAQLGKVERELHKAYDNLPKPISRYAIDDGCGGLHDIQSQKYAAQEIYAKQDALSKLIAEPYIGRLDVSKQGKGRTIYYIGKEDKQVGKLYVHSRWSEQGRLFGRTAEPNGFIDGRKQQVYLRRKIDIRAGKLRGIEDVFSSNTEYAEKGIYDKFLIQVLMTRKKSHQLTDIIATIQEKQNEIIEKTCFSNIIVQGCAGSGKTMVMLHRISFWLYNNKSLKPEKIRILTPNENFNAHISELHTQLNLGAIDVMSVDQYYVFILRKYDKGIASFSKIDEEENIEERFLNYIYSKQFLKQFTKSYKELLPEYALIEEIELINSYAKKCGISSRVKGGSTEGETILEMSNLIHAITIKSSSAMAKVERIKEKIKELNEEYTKCLERKSRAQETINRYENSYKNSLRTLLDKEISSYSEEAEMLDSQKVALEERLASLNGSFLKIFNASDIKKTEAALEEIKEKLEENNRNCSIFTQLVTDLDAFESIEDVIRKINSRKITKDNLAIMDYFAVYKNEKRILFEQEALMKKTADYKAKEESKLSSTTLKLSNKEYEIINKLEKKYPINVGLAIFNRVFDKTTKEKLTEMNMERPQKVYRYELYARVLFSEMFWDKIVGDDELICIDEGQDVSFYEYERIIAQNKNNYTFYNVYGDLNQRIKQGRGLKTWEQLKRKLLAHEYELNENYRNTNQITQYCNDIFGFDMTLTGVEGEPVRNITFNEMLDETVLLANKTERTAIILPRNMSKQRVTKAKKVENIKNRFSAKYDTSKISVMYVDEIKGIEFDRVFVVDQDMERNERYIAFTRALDNLSIVH